MADKGAKKPEKAKKMMKVRKIALLCCCLAGACDQAEILCGSKDGGSSQKFGTFNGISLVGLKRVADL
ncbi:MAG: hypothetical protein CL814_07500 [Confluentimicrobium sp.]|jgi:hypothetical protein|nr:hypothetical protein [Actibacterium sp.]|tara:strand:- start:436 stop:639 length:204 start_codon:yes stop_codon:yes gene_type:complete